MGKVFYCDDEDQMHGLIKTILGDEEEVHTSGNPMDAYRLIRDNLREHREKSTPLYDLLLTDLNMNGCETVHGEVMDNGITLAKAVRRIDPELPVILTSGGTFLDGMVVQDEGGNHFGTISPFSYRNKAHALGMVGQKELELIKELGISSYLNRLRQYASECQLNLGVEGTNILLAIPKPTNFRIMSDVLQSCYRENFR